MKRRRRSTARALLACSVSLLLLSGGGAACAAATGEPSPQSTDRDTDGDGVVDRLDGCPDTLPRARVNSAGCLAAGQTIALSNIHFESDSATLTLEARDVLDAVGASLRSQGDVYFTIAGYSDARGSRAYNQQLSFARAHSVRRYLASIGLRESHMRARGYGESQPVDSNATRDGRARNRRVEFHIEDGPRR